MVFLAKLYKKKRHARGLGPEGSDEKQNTFFFGLRKSHDLSDK